MKKRPKLIDDEGQALWQEVAKTVTPLGERPLAPELPPRRMVRPLDRAPDLPSEWHAHAAPQPDSFIDRKTRRRLASGRMEVDRAVDLHGMRQDQALGVLMGVVKGAVLRGDKTLLVVTGKGGARFSQTESLPAAFRTRDSFDQFGGVLKRMVPLWLEGPDLKPFIQSYGTAAPEHGGEGALYILLRRRIPGSKTS